MSWALVHAASFSLGGGDRRSVALGSRTTMADNAGAGSSGRRTAGHGKHPSCRIERSADRRSWRAPGVTGSAGRFAARDSQGGNSNLGRVGIFKELWLFLKYRKRWWLGPLLVVLVLVGMLLVMA